MRTTESSWFPQYEEMNKEYLQLTWECQVMITSSPFSLQTTEHVVSSIMIKLKQEGISVTG
jgi:hypothetical protein